MELELYKEAELIVKKQIELEKHYEVLEEIKGSVPNEIVFEYLHDYEIRIKPNPEIFHKVIESATSIVVEKLNELEQQFKEL